MLTPKQVAERVGVSDSLVYEWCAQGLLKHYRFGGKGRRGCIRIESTISVLFWLRAFTKSSRKSRRSSTSN